MNRQVIAALLLFLLTMIDDIVDYWLSGQMVKRWGYYCDECCILYSGMGRLPMVALLIIISQLLVI